MDAVDVVSAEHLDGPAEHVVQLCSPVLVSAPEVLVVESLAVVLGGKADLLDAEVDSIALYPVDPYRDLKLRGGHVRDLQPPPPQTRLAHALGTPVGNGGQAPKLHHAALSSKPFNPADQLFRGERAVPK